MKKLIPVLAFLALTYQGARATDGSTEFKAVPYEGESSLPPSCREGREKVVVQALVIEQGVQIADASGAPVVAVEACKALEDGKFYGLAPHKD